MRFSLKALFAAVMMLGGQVFTAAPSSALPVAPVEKAAPLANALEGTAQVQQAQYYYYRRHYRPRYYRPYRRYYRPRYYYRPRHYYRPYYHRRYYYGY